jgi:glycosyltransferase involved in cell wall biosynthesis
LRSLVAGRDIEGVDLVGPQGRRELDALISGSLFVVVPSEWLENSPMSILESFAHGRAVLASNVGGIPELIADGAGLLFEPGNVEDLSSKMALLLADSELRNALGSRGRARLQTHYAPEAHCAALGQAFHRALDGVQQASPVAA